MSNELRIERLEAAILYLARQMHHPFPFLERPVETVEAILRPPEAELDADSATGKKD